jgi:dimethylhistidine N-methyltransferase
MYDAELATPSAESRGVVLHDHRPEPASFRDALWQGLAAEEKSIPCRFLYDARGSALFDAICRAPEYYPTRTELAILRRIGPELAERLGRGVEVVELGSGSEQKALVLLDALREPGRYTAVDISREALLASTRRVRALRPDLQVHAVCADFAKPFGLPDSDPARRLGFFPGSTIGNFEPDDAVRFLHDWRRRLGPGSRMLIGVDRVKDAAVLQAAYDDAAGVTRAFIGNILVRANREADASFDLDAFRYEASWRPESNKVRMSLVSLRDQVVTVAGRAFRVGRGEALHVEDSHKYEPDAFARLARRAGYRAEACWTDEERLFSVHLLA